MIKNYLLLAFKNLRKQKVFSLINILGLTVGITCCLMIFLFIKHESSFDDFHTNGKDIYRVVRMADNTGSGDKRMISWVSGPYAKALKNDYPDAIVRAVRVSPDNYLFSYNNISFNEKKVFATDTDFFKIFDFQFIKGNPTTVLQDPASIVLTASTAKKYFGNEDPMGKVLQRDKKQFLKVTGIVKDVPSNSHLNFDMIIPISNFKYHDSTKNFPYNGLYTYVQLSPRVNPQQLVSHFPAFMDKYLGKYYAANGYKMALDLEPLKNIYFDDVHDNVKHGNKKIVFIFMSIAILILIIACINFMNLATARATDRSKEVGMRKVMGAVRNQLIGQFILESFLYATLSSVFALIILQLLMQPYTHLLGYELPSYWTDPWIYIFILFIVLVIGLLAGSYPAILLSSFSPIEALKGRLNVGKSSAFFRKALVVFQFSISVILIICITVIKSQMGYIRNKDLGFNKEQSLMVKIDNMDIYDGMRRFKNTVASNPGVISVSLMSGEPGGFHDGQGFEAEAKPEEKLILNTEFADFEFVKSLGLKIIAGRDFSPSFPTDSLQAVLINRTASEKLGYKTPAEAIGKWIKNTDRDSLRRNIVGVVEDYHFASLKEKIDPLIISTSQDWRLALIRLTPSNHLQSTISDINNLYTSVAPGYPFEYNFLDEEFNQHYKDDAKQDIILSIFSAIAIFIACLGLFGLASYTAVKRTKEIGVRKVLGSSVKNIAFLLSKDLLKPVLLGTCVAIPVGYFLMNKWLQGFAYRTNIYWWMLVLAGAVAVLIALITVSSQAIKAAMSNPIKSLRTE